MIDFLPATDATIFFSLILEGEPISGASISVDIITPSGTAVVSGQAAGDQGNGTYTYTVPASLLTEVGTYRVIWTITNPVNLVKHDTFQVGYESLPTLTVQDVRHSLSDLLEGPDAWSYGMVDQASPTSITSTILAEPVRHWNGAWLAIVSGTGRGQERRVVNWDQTSLTVTPAFAVTPDATSEFEIHREFRVEQYNRAIRLAVLEAARQVLIPVSFPLTLVDHQYEYTLPGGFSHLFRVEVRDGRCAWRPVAPGAWEVIRARRILRLHPHVIAEFANQPAQLLGLRPPIDPISDYSPVDVPAQFVLYWAAAYLCGVRARGADQSTWEKRQAQYLALAERERVLFPRVPNNAKRVE